MTEHMDVSWPTKWVLEKLYSASTDEADSSYNASHYFGHCFVNPRPRRNGPSRNVSSHVPRHLSKIGPTNLINGSEKGPSRPSP